MTLVVALFAAIPASLAAAGPPVADVSFDGDGLVVTDLGGLDAALGALIQPDQKIVVAGVGQSGANGDFALARYNSNGALDSSFNGGGKLMTDLRGGSDAAFAVVIQPDGKIVAAGATSPSADFALVRYNADGSLDGSFGTGGKVFTDFGRSESAYALAVQSDGKLVAAGRTRAAGSTLTSPSDFAVARYTTNGSLDGSFGIGGKVVVDLGAIEQAEAIAAAPDGTLVTAGVRYPPGNTDGADVVLVRLNGAGTVMAQTVTDLGGGDAAYALVLQPDGRVVVAGTGGPPGNAGFALLRFDSSGALDASFGTGGKTVVAAAREARALVQRTDGILVAIGTNDEGNLAAARFSRSGKLEGAVGAFDLGGRDDGEAAVVQDDGKVVAVGTTGSDFALVRFTLPRCLVPSLVGKTLPAAKKALVIAGCTLGKIRRATSPKPAGRVIRQTPAARRELAPDAKVDLIVSSGRPR